ncbi:serine/threonine protein kinase [Streptomyces phaeochromogenes]|uniref:serine/threonine-protein kinase n=1 Tax=Streptomyces phaeochromogenes TaxID=1923 RepID=UPI002DD8E757|nr:serine/threonine-protein kinase [Streptomyces phaeochromogenes]WRZ31043.1 serine/threonine protein kinase [Streptomyces phaeochromogenes]
MSDEGRLIAGRYRLIERIGRGGMGTVWRAEDEVLGREIALKRLHAQQHLSEDELATVYERTRREARSAARITHPNVVVVHDVLDDEGLPCIVMEYVHGTTLGALLKGGGALPPGEAARIGLGMVAALRAAHAAGVLHRDVKPGNVLLGGNGRVVLTDFGIAMATGTSTLTKTGEIIGSIDYIAPERMRGHKPGPTADLWALGATLFQSVEGRPPFRKATAMETAYAIAVDPLASMKQAGPLEPLIEMLLAKDPDERPSAEETERALRVVASEALGAMTGPTMGGTTEAAWASAVPGRATATVAATGPTGPTGPTRPTTSAGATLTDSGSAAGSGAGPVSGSGAVPAPTGGSGDGSGDGAGRRGRRRRPLLWSAAAVALVAAAVAGGLYAMSADGGGHGSKGGSATATTPTASEPPPVPAGFRLVREKALGATFPVPDGWKRVDKASSEQVTYTDPSGLVGLTIGTVNPAGANPESHFQNIEANTKLNYSTYRKLRMQRTTFQGKPAAVWEFTFQGQVRAFRAIDFGFGEEGGTEYDIYLSAPEAQWDKRRPVFDTVKAGFRVG